MKRPTLILASLLGSGLLAFFAVKGAMAVNESKPFPATDIEWKGFLGKNPENEQELLVLLAKGFLGMGPMGGEPAFAPDLDQQIDAWMKRHPTAMVVPVRRIPLDEEFAFLHVWIVDGAENLNIQLVRRGACPADIMQTQRREGALQVSAKDYDTFERDLQNAQTLAIAEKLGIWALPRFQNAAHWEEAVRLEKEGKFEAAIAQFHKAIEEDSERSTGWLRIARCYDKLNRYQEAIEAFDKAIELDESGISARGARIEKALCVSRREGTAKGAAVFGDTAPDCSRNLEPCLDLAVVHASQNQPQLAAQGLEKGVQAYITHHQLEFEGDSFKFDLPRLERNQDYWVWMQELGHGLEPLAEYWLQAGDLDKALSIASQGLSLQQAIKARANGMYDATVAQAGDFGCRMVRANVFIQRSAFAEAKRELDQAKVLIDVGNVQGGFLMERLNQGYADLQARFPGESIGKPPAYKQRLAEIQTPTPERIAAASESDLLALAAEENPAASFAALEELLARQLDSRLSPASFQQLVADGLARQRDERKPWRAQYGVFIEQAWENAGLTPEQEAQYVRHSAIPTLTADYADFEIDRENLVRLGLNITLEPRVGGSLGSRDQRPEARLSATVRLDEVSIDGKTAPYGLKRREITYPPVPLRAGFIQGKGYPVTNTSNLPVGAHKVTVRVTVEIREGDFSMRRPEDSATAKPLLTWESTLSAEFEVPPM